jgi:hypothetical protein
MNIRIGVKQMVVAGIFSIANLLILIGGAAIFALFLVVLFKLNKALNIWLEKNKH